MSANVVAGDSIIAEVEKLIKEDNLSLEQIYNCDETGMYWKALPEKTLVALKLGVVGKSKNPRCLQNVNRSALPAHYLNQKNAWMYSHLFSKWFFDIFVPSVKSWQEKANLNGALLLFDSLPAYPGTDFRKTGGTKINTGKIRCLFLPPNTTSLLQPMDQGVLESLKRRYRRKLIRKLLFEGESAFTVSILEFRKSVNIKDCVLESLKWRYRKKLIRKLLFEGESASTVSILEFRKSVNIKDCIYMISEAWKSMPQLTLRRSWRKLFPKMLQTLRKMALLNFQTFLARCHVLKTVGSKKSQIGLIVAWKMQASSCLMMRKLSQKSDILQKKTNKKMAMKAGMIPK
ncbi:Tigger transposable element-derived protein 2 [Araneus ventricosus]|uniref:Tigger transposable element-derived protein 2 n=1 Tax=Araneus ventricosus TaxID=182803 RepID=A0A4Y2W0H5_ARAVE|nr:Tigger transposable element-derived protein 2 [Araneus ventricosus]